MAVFKTIAELVTATEFQEATYQYLDLHKEVFTDDDENKLEYTPIFENYVNILEQVIDSKLQQSYGADDILGFYLDFKDNFKQYEGENEEVVDTLFGFVDFNRFKQQMLQFKAGCVDLDPKKYEAYADYSKKGEEYFYSLLTEDVNNKKLGWNKKLNHS